MNYFCLAGTVAIATLSLSVGVQQTPRATTAGPLMQPTEEAKAPTLPSPAAVAEIKLGGRAVTVHYNTPHVRGRAIMGSLVPYGKVWRTGANPATSFTTAADLIIGNLHVPAGRYTLYTLPAPPGTPWLLILSKETDHAAACCWSHPGAGLRD